MFAFVDETGNTGANIFDEDQPDFFSGALVTKSNFDLAYGQRVQAICELEGITSIHASVVGRKHVESIAKQLLPVLKEADARFFFSRVEKNYVVATKVFDTFFDSGENPAVPWTAYNIRPLRLILVFKLASVLTYEIVTEFWAMLMARNEKSAREKIPPICDALIPQLEFIRDARSRQILGDALRWSRDHPEALDIFIAGRQAKNGHMPNMVAFANLLDGLETLSKKWNRPLRRLLHDRQSQFQGSLEEWHRVFSNASDEPISRPGETFVFQKVKGSTFAISASGDSHGIQVADLVLWLFKQMLDRKPMGPSSIALLNYALHKGMHHDFSFKGVGEATEERFEEIMSKDISAEQLARGRELNEEYEGLRQSAMIEYEKDGLMPYERQNIEARRRHPAKTVAGNKDKK